jgi:hypothetical protein
VPSRRGGRERDAGALARQCVEFAGALRIRHHVADGAALEAVGQIGATELRGGRHHDEPELHGAEERFPERNDVGEHDEDAVPATRAERLQPVRDLVASRRQLREGERRLGRVVARQPEGGPCVVPRVCVEPVERPVEAVEHRPAEFADGLVVSLAPGEQQRPRLEERLRAHVARRC